MSKLVHINSIEMVRCEELVPMKILSDTTCRFSREPDFIKMNIQELVGVSIENNYENNQNVFSTTATFSTSCKFPLTNRRFAFRLTSVDGKRYMIGTKNRPYPIIKEKNPFPEKPSDSTLKTVSITWKALHPMMLILE
ncbi:MAG: hypothetical protein ACTTKJ_06530 [Prevotella koreensis]|uniref:hypothetical protein n=1 Tax=Prevotella koreensis TaxID=2490854 RepID=UPI003F9F67FE